jgi:hypothetical protein
VAEGRLSLPDHSQKSEMSLLEHEIGDVTVDSGSEVTGLWS